MITLNIGNSYSKITGLREEDFKSLYKLLSFMPDAAGYGAQFNRRKYLCDKKGNFPSGLLPRVRRFLKERSLGVMVINTLPVPKRELGLTRPFGMKDGPEPYRCQLDAVEACLRSNKGGTVSMVTGSGKSLTMVHLVNALQLKTLIVVPTIELKNQLTNTFTTFFGSMDNVVIENIGSSNLNKHKNFDCLIIDEAHHSAAKTYRDLNKRAWKGIYYRFCFTATPFRSKSEEQMLMECITGQVIYELSYKDAVQLGIVCPIEAYYVEVPEKISNKITYADVYKDLVVNNEPRNEIIANLIGALSLSGVSTLTLVREIEHGNKLSDLCGVHFIQGNNEDNPDKLFQFNQEHIKHLIGTAGILGEGVDTKPAEYVIIALLGKSKNALMQQIGRVIRTYPGKTSSKVILFKDDSHKFTKSHFKEQCKIIKEQYGCTPVKLDFS